MDGWTNGSQAKAIVRAAYKGGSGDNLTASVIAFDWAREKCAAINAERDRLRLKKQEEVRATYRYNDPRTT